MGMYSFLFLLFGVRCDLSKSKDEKIIKDN